MKQLFPSVAFRDNMEQADLGFLGLASVLIPPKPTYDPKTQIAKLGSPTLNPDGTWSREWFIEDKPVVIPTVVTMRQARLALLEQGLLAQVEVALASLPSPDKEKAQIEWEYATVVRRDSTLVQQLSSALNFTEEQLDTLFAQGYNV